MATTKERSMDMQEILSGEILSGKILAIETDRALIEVENDENEQKWFPIPDRTDVGIGWSTAKVNDFVYVEGNAITLVW